MTTSAELQTGWWGPNSNSHSPRGGGTACATRSPAPGTPITTVSRVLGRKTVAEPSSVYSQMLTGSDETRRNAAADVLLRKQPRRGRVKTQQ